MLPVASQEFQRNCVGTKIFQPSVLKSAIHVFPQQKAERGWGGQKETIQPKGNEAFVFFQTKKTPHSQKGVSFFDPDPVFHPQLQPSKLPLGVGFAEACGGRQAHIRNAFSARFSGRRGDMGLFQAAKSVSPFSFACCGVSSIAFWKPPKVGRLNGKPAVNCNCSPGSTATAFWFDCLILLKMLWSQRTSFQSSSGHSSIDAQHKAVGCVFSRRYCFQTGMFGCLERLSGRVPIFRAEFVRGAFGGYKALLEASNPV